MGLQLSQSGSTAIPSGVYQYAVTGLGLPFTPTSVTVNLRKPNGSSPNITATPVGAPTDAGFSVELSTATESTGYFLDWIVWASSTALDTTGTLQASYTDLCKEVARFLGYNPDSLSSEQTSEVDAYVQAGIRNFYFPPAVNGIEAGFEWSFMRPSATLTTVANVGIAALPEDLARVIGDFHFAPTQYVASAIQVSESRVMTLLQREAGTGAPRCFAARFKRYYGAHGQTQEVIFWPTPDAAYVLNYRYEAYNGKLSALNPCPLGGARFSELITESCLSIAEQRANDERGLHTERFFQLLAAGIEMDRRNGARYFGQMGESPSSTQEFTRSSSVVLYNGIPI